MHAIPVTHASHWRPPAAAACGRLHTWYSRRSRFSWRPPAHLVFSSLTLLMAAAAAGSSTTSKVSSLALLRRSLPPAAAAAPRPCGRLRPPAAACGRLRRRAGKAPPQLVDNAEGFVAPAPQAAAAVCGGGRGSSATSKVPSLTLLRRPLPLPRPCAAAGTSATSKDVRRFRRSPQAAAAVCGGGRGSSATL